MGGASSGVGGWQVVGNGACSCGKLLKSDSKRLRFVLGGVRKLFTNPVFHLFEFRPQFGNEVVFTLCQMLLQTPLPVMKPRTQISLNGSAGFLGRLPATAGNRLDLLGQAAGFFALARFLRIEALPDSLKLQGLIFLGAKNRRIDRVISKRGCLKALFQSGEPLFESMKLPSDNDLTDSLDLLGRGGCG